MADFADGAAGRVERLGRGDVEREAVFRDAGDADGEVLGVCDRDVAHPEVESVDEVRGGCLSELALRGDAGDDGARASAGGERVEVGECGVGGGGQRRGDKGVAEGGEPEVAYLEVAGEGARGTAGAETQECVVVAAD